MTDIVKARREGMRWLFLTALNNARPIGAVDQLMLTVAQDMYPDTTANELHQQLEYLESKSLVEIEKRPDGHWHSKLSSFGVDVVEYTEHCPTGIARPQKYWK